MFLIHIIFVYGCIPSSSAMNSVLATSLASNCDKRGSMAQKTTLDARKAGYRTVNHKKDSVSNRQVYCWLEALSAYGDK